MEFIGTLQESRFWGVKVETLTTHSLNFSRNAAKGTPDCGTLGSAKPFDMLVNGEAYNQAPELQTPRIPAASCKLLTKGY